MKEPSNESIELAAQAWCDPECGNIVMDVTLAMAFARILDVVREKWKSGNLECADYVADWPVIPCR